MQEKIEASGLPHKKIKEKTEQIKKSANGLQNVPKKRAELERKRSQAEKESGRLKEREVQEKIEASGQRTLRGPQDSSLSRPPPLPLQASPAHLPTP